MRVAYDLVCDGCGRLIPVVFSVPDNGDGGRMDRLDSRCPGCGVVASVEASVSEWRILGRIQGRESDSVA